MGGIHQRLAAQGEMAQACLDTRTPIVIIVAAPFSRAGGSAGKIDIMLEKDLHRADGAPFSGQTQLFGQGETGYTLCRVAQNLIGLPV